MRKHGRKDNFFGRKDGRKLDGEKGIMKWSKNSRRAVLKHVSLSVKEGYGMCTNAYMWKF